MTDTDSDAVVPKRAAKSIRHYLDHNLQHRTTGRDPKTNGYTYAEVPEWALRQWLAELEGPTGEMIVCGCCGETVRGPCDHPDDPCGLYRWPAIDDGAGNGTASTRQTADDASGIAQNIGDFNDPQ